MMMIRLFWKRFRIEREHGGSAIFRGLEPELDVCLSVCLGRELGIELAKIPSRLRVRLVILFLSKLALSISLILRHFKP